MSNQNRYQKEILLLCEKWHRTAEQVHKELKKDYFFLGIWTVYRNLQELVDQDILMKTNGVIDKVIYEMKKPDHWHLYCKRTGWILDVDISSLSIDKVDLPKEFQLDDVEITFRWAFIEPNEDNDNCVWSVSKKEAVTKEIIK